MLNSKKKQNKGDAEKEQIDEKDEICEMLHQLREIDKVHSITVKEDVFFFTTTAEEIAQDIKQFYCGANACFWSGHNLQFMKHVGKRYVLS